MHLVRKNPRTTRLSSFSSSARLLSANENFVTVSASNRTSQLGIDSGHVNFTAEVRSLFAKALRNLLLVAIQPRTRERWWKTKASLIVV